MGLADSNPSKRPDGMREMYPQDCPNCGLWLTADSRDCPRCFVRLTANLDDWRHECRCLPWQQRWRPEAPERCVNCGGLFPPHTVAARR